jgi:hypothetical protein
MISQIIKFGGDRTKIQMPVNVIEKPKSIFQ